MHKSIYLDYNATTPVDSRVLAAMKPYFEAEFGNPASQLHAKGWEAKNVVERARQQVADLLQAESEEITFTAGSTESNNWALKGLVDYLKDLNPHEPLHVLASNVEHASVREPLLYLKRKGLIELDLVPVNSQGYITLETLKKYKKPHTRILSLIWIHNEIGTIQNIKDISCWAEQNGIYFHTDATQAVGKIDINLKELPISLLSFSAHKLYGPKGVGGLYIRNSNPKIKLSPLLHGGGQEGSGRSGTLNVPAVVGLGEACSIAKKEMNSDWEKLRILSQELWQKIESEFPAAKLNGPPVDQRTVYNLNMTFPGIQGSNLIPMIPDLCVSGGSACSSGNFQGNPVLLAIGHNPEDLSVSLRISLGKSTSRDELHQAFLSIRKALKSIGFSGNPKGSQGLTSVLI